MLVFIFRVAVTTDMFTSLVINDVVAIEDSVDDDNSVVVDVVVDSSSETLVFNTTSEQNC